jgi:hypothetical protein
MSVFFIPSHIAVLVSCIIRSCSVSIRHGKGSTIQDRLDDIREPQAIDGLREWTMGNPLPHAFLVWSVLLAFDVTLALPYSNVFCDSLTLDL